MAKAARDPPVFALTQMFFNAPRSSPERASKPPAAAAGSIPSCADRARQHGGFADKHNDR
jgi:hypothetical protein